jgi:dTDP-glucose 4,6-dehydratase
VRDARARRRRSDGERRAVVLGGGGFVGSHLCDRLLRDGTSVAVVDSWVTGDRANLEHLVGHPRLLVLDGDITRGIEVTGPIHEVFHLASPASPVDYRRHPEATLRAGSIGTFRAIELAERTSARLLFASTSEVYGDPLVHPQPESYLGNVDPVGPRAMYDEAKRFGEAAVSSAVREGALDAVIARLFNTVGPRMRLDDGRMVPSFVASVLEDRPLVIHGDGTQTRSVADVEDIVDGLVRLADADADVLGPVNLGNPDEHPVLEIAEWVAEALGVAEFRCTFVPRTEGDPQRRCPDVTLARETVGWRPRRSARDAVMRAARALAASARGEAGAVRAVAS